MSVTAARKLMAATTPASGSFSPDDIASLSGWWDASSSSNFTFSSGSNIATWIDLSSNGYTLILVSGTPPTLTRTIGGVSAVDFGGSQYLGRSNAPINNSSDGAWTIFAVVEFDTVTGAQNVVDGDAGTGTRVGQFIRSNGTTAESIGFNTGVVAKVDTYSPPLAASTPVLMRSINTSTTVEIFCDSVGDGSTSMNGTQAYSATCPFSLGVYSQTRNAQFLNGAIGEVICYSTALAAGDITSVEDYLTTKWGL